MFIGKEASPVEPAKHFLALYHRMRLTVYRRLLHRTGRLSAADAIAADVVEMIVDSVEKTLSTMGSDPNERALGAAATFFKTINEALCNNLVLNRQLIENIPLDDFMTRLRVPLEHEIAERDLLPQGLKDEMFDYYLAFLLSGIIGIYRTWALSDGSVPIERVSEVANDLTLNGLSSLESRLD